MSSFDKILKRGKEAVSARDPSDDWKNCIGYVLGYIQLLNEMYDDKRVHNVELKNIWCDRCKRATFILIGQDPNEEADKLYRFNIGDWVLTPDAKCYCPDCK